MALKAKFERKAGIGIRVMGGSWHDGHFDLQVGARPANNGAALVLVFEDGLPVDEDAIRETGEKLGREIASLLSGNAKAAVALAGGTPNARLD